MQNIAQVAQQELIKDNEYGIIFENNKNMKLIQVIAGNKFQTAEGAAYRHMNIINNPWGSKIQAFNKEDKYIHVIKPKSTLITDNLARKTQILYSMDNASIVFKLNVIPGSIVVQAGTGSGSLSCAFSEALGPKGHLYTFQFNKQRAQITKDFFQQLKKDNITSTWRDVVQNGFQIENVNIQADALFLDVPNPWATIQHTKKVLKKFGRICCFSPCIEQVQKTIDQMRKKRFTKIETYQCLLRQIEVNEKQIPLQGVNQTKRLSRSSKLVHNSRGHTGFLTFAVSV